MSEQGHLLRIGRLLRHWCLRALDELAIPLDRALDTDYSTRLAELESGFNCNRYPLDPDKWSYCRVPKTGSGTVSRVLRLLAYDLCSNLDRHVPVSSDHPPGAYKYFTFLRDPRDRVWSHYHMELHRGSRRGWGAHVHKGFEHFCRCCWESQNMMVKYYSSRCRKAVGLEELQIAIDALAKFRFVGFYEDLQQDLPLLLEALGRSTPSLVIPHENRPVGPRSPMSPREFEVATYYNELDLQLYREVRQAHGRQAG